MEETKVKLPSENNPAVNHESTDVNVRGVLFFGVGLTVVAVIIHIAVWFLYDYFASPQHASLRLPQQPAPTRSLPSKAQLQVEPVGELSQLRSSEEQTLRSYAWIDREKGIVRIPIERAMEIVARAGPPTRKETRSGAEAALGKKKER